MVLPTNKTRNTLFLVEVVHPTNTECEQSKCCVYLLVRICVSKHISILLCEGKPEII